MVDRRTFKGISIFAIMHDIIETELTGIETFLNEVSTNLRDKQAEIDNKFKAAVKDEIENEGHDIYSFFEDDINKYFKVFPVYTYNPMLLAVYAVFESWLKKLCDLDSSRRLSGITVKDLAGQNYIEKSRRYLKLVAEIDVSVTDNQWARIVLIQKIRNRIAHNNSNIIEQPEKPLNKQPLHKIVFDDPRIELNNQSGDFYIKDKNFLSETIVLLKQHLFWVIEQLSNRKVLAMNNTMAYNNAAWGEEKTSELISSVIGVLDQLDNYEVRTDEFKDSDLKTNLRGDISSMAWNLTKLLAFFSNGKWETHDRDIIVNERQKGLTKLKKLYC